MHSLTDDTIVAAATPQGVSALAIVRLSGKDSIRLASSLFSGKDLKAQHSHTLHVGYIQDGNRVIDQVVVALYRAPRSFTREDSVEITCHGSPLIVKEIINLFVRHGARLAEPGEFTKRAFLNGGMDLTQAEAVADLINSETENARQAALNQMRGGFSKEIDRLRQELIQFASLVELELDFGEEDVEFASRTDLRDLIQKVHTYLNTLIDSFDQGNVIKNGIPAVIAGKPNSGKSTLLNALLNEERAIVSPIPGTTRDVIEDEIILDGLRFRFVDTAGLRNTDDVIETMGIERTRANMQKASLIIYLFDLSTSSTADIDQELSELATVGVPFLKVGNKVDVAPPELIRELEGQDFIFISARDKLNIEGLKERLLSHFQVDTVRTGDVLVTNLRHYYQLVRTREALLRVVMGLDNQVTGDFLAMDIRQALRELGEITGAITSEDLLANIFSKFCIGK